jgi:transcriptional regulator with XRE-family HTH domain
LSQPRYTLKSAEKFRWFMANPWTGKPFTVRTLADVVNVSPGLIQKLANGSQDTADVLVAHALVRAFGCSILNLFAPPVTPNRVTATTDDDLKEE